MQGNHNTMIKRIVDLFLRNMIFRDKRINRKREHKKSGLGTSVMRLLLCSGRGR